MPAKTAAERMKEYRSRMNKEKKQHTKQRNRDQQKACRSKWNLIRKKKESVYSTERKRNLRTKLKTEKLASAIPVEAFGSRQTFKALKRVRLSFPDSPRKKTALIILYQCIVLRNRNSCSTARTSQAYTSCALNSY